MTTTADFYTGHGRHAVWLGSLQGDADPTTVRGVACGRLLLDATDPLTYADAAELPVLGATEPPTARFTYTFRGHQIPITQTMRLVPQTYLDHRGESATAVAGAAELVVRRRWPLPDLAATAVREIAQGLLRPGPGPNLYVLPDDAPFVYESASWPRCAASSTPTATPRTTTPTMVSRC